MSRDPREPERDALPPGSEESSLELLSRAQAGSSEALEGLLRRYVPRLRRWAAGRLPGYARHLLETQDLVQESVVGVITHLEDLRPTRAASLQAYFRQAILNRIRDEARRPYRPAELAVDGPHDRDPTPSPLEQTVHADTLARYERALAKLDEEPREMILARIELGMSYRDIAMEFGKSSPDAARMAVGRTLVRVAEEMRDERAR